MNSAEGRALTGEQHADLDTITCLRLGEALYRFLARLNDESECDVFSWEDRGVSIDAGFIEFDYDTVDRVQLLIEKASSGAGGSA